MIETITVWFNEAVNFLKSAEFQAVVTATIGFVTSIALIQNRVAALKVAKTENVMLAHNVEILTLEKKINQQSELMKNLETKLELQSAMFALAFLNSKKLDGQTKQELARLATQLQKSNPQQVKDSNVLETVTQIANQVVNNPIKDVIQEATSIYQKLTKV
jgi:hypothetical protein